MKPLKCLLLSGVVLSLGACGTSESLGLGKKKAPDEFQVITRAPLEVPYGLTLPVPQPGAPRPQEVSAEEQAKEAIFGATELEGATAVEQVVIGENTTATQPPTQMQPIVEGARVVKTPAMTKAEPIAEDDPFMAKMGASEDNSNVRAALEKDLEDDNTSGLPIGTKLLGFGDKDKKASVLDAQAEVEKLKTDENVAVPDYVVEGAAELKAKSDGVKEGEEPAEPVEKWQGYDQKPEKSGYE